MWYPYSWGTVRVRGMLIDGGVGGSFSTRDQGCREVL